MRATTPVLIALGLSACSSGGLVDRPLDTDDTDSDYVDTGDTDAEVVETQQCHPADPLDLQAGWTRTYAVTWEGNTGTEVQSGMGPGVASTGAATYLVKSELTATSGDNLTTLEHRACDSTGRAAFHESSSTGNATIDLLGTGFGIPTPVDIKRFNSVPEPYLVGLSTLEGTGDWTYSYELMTVNASGGGLSLDVQIPNCNSGLDPQNTENDAMCVPVTGNVTALGVQTVTVPAGTFEAYYILNERTEKWSEASSGMGELDAFLEIFAELFPMPGLFGGTEDVKTIQQVWYVEGIGLIKEITALQVLPTEPVMVRELTSHTVPVSQQ